MDLLKKAALAYDKLLDVEYLFVSGKNGQLHSHILRFTSDEFKHTIGLHKLTDIPTLCRSSSSNILFSIKNDQLTLDDISKSTAYSQIENRIRNLAYLENYLDNALLYYDWEAKRSPFSNIEASIMIPSQSLVNSGQNTYIFFKNTDSGVLKLAECIVETAKSQKLVSLISDKRDYTRGQVRPPTLLYKEKREVSTGTKTVLLDKLSPKQSLQNEQNNPTKPVKMDVAGDNAIPVKFSVQGGGAIALAPQAPQSDLLTRIANALVKGLDNIVHKASMAFEKINVAATKALNTLFAPEQPKKPLRASQSQSKGKSLAKAKNAEMARPAAPVKQSEQKQEKRSSVLADLKTIKAEQAQDKPDRSHQRSKTKSNNIEL